MKTIYRMAVMKRGYGQKNGVMLEDICGSRFATEMLPGEKHAALARLTASPADLILLDLSEDAASGLWLLRQLRMAGLSSGVIVYIRKDDCATLRSALRLGVLDCLVDPFDTDRFVLAVRRFLYREKLLERRGSLTQGVVDAIRSENCGVPELPKGLQRKTLNMIRAVFSDRPQDSLSCRDIVGTVNLSRITVQRYLAYLQQSGEVTEDLRYGASGRPCALYRYRRRSLYA